MYRCASSTRLLSLHLLNSRSLQSLLRPYFISTNRAPVILLAMPKRKSLSTVTQGPAITTVPIPVPKLDLGEPAPPPSKRRATQRRVSQAAHGSTNPDKNANVLDGPEALRASPDADEKDERMDLEQAGMDVDKQVKEEDSDLSDLSDISEPAQPKKGCSTAQKGLKKEAAAGKKDTAGPILPSKKEAINVKEPQFLDPEAEGDEEADEEEIQAALSRPPPVNSDYLPLPWKGRLGYVSIICTAMSFLLTSLRPV